MNNFLQFELWKDCNNKCSFCFNDNRVTSRESKKERLFFILNELTNPKYTSITKVGFIGGEFFDGQMDDELFGLFQQVIAKSYLLPNVKQVLVTTSLLFEDLTKVITISNMFNRRNTLLFCTSWDTFGRFHTQESINLWEKNIDILHREVPTQQIHVEIIPTQRHILDVLNNKFNIQDFSNKFKVSVDYCTPCSGFIYKDKYDFEKHVPGFFPKRGDFLKFLYKVYSDGQATADMFTNYNNMSTLLWMSINGEYKLIEGYRGPIDGVTVNKDYPLPPMHTDKSDYIDSDARMRKDVLDVWETIYG